ncbi:hypothetical protein MA16_Dca000830 [Dendrobium catenatum]|uniref:Uncharacterized protein n=1 Tax=Dendrobium catenatum TaxID=906689 RepID=A0A2I0WUZ6_9ASPA|nr:hypothetical protein MA16_Dca000830 [Dendrobium catenatum]
MTPRVSSDHHLTPEFLLTTTGRQSSPRPPPDVGVPTGHHRTPEFRRITTRCRSSTRPLTIDQTFR